MIVDNSVPTPDLNRKINKLVAPPFLVFSSLSHGWNRFAPNEY